MIGPVVGFGPAPITQAGEVPRGLATVYFPSVGKIGLALADLAASNDQPLPAPFPAVQLFFELPACEGIGHAPGNPAWYYFGSLVFTGSRAFIIKGTLSESIIAASTMHSDGTCQDGNFGASGYQVEPITIPGYPWTSPVRMIYQ